MVTAAGFDDSHAAVVVTDVDVPFARPATAASALLLPMSSNWLLPSIDTDVTAVLPPVDGPDGLPHPQAADAITTDVMSEDSRNT